LLLRVIQYFYLPVLSPATQSDKVVETLAALYSTPVDTNETVPDEECDRRRMLYRIASVHAKYLAVPSLFGSSIWISFVMSYRSTWTHRPLTTSVFIDQKKRLALEAVYASLV
jgi:hypothetical protein